MPIFLLFVALPLIEIALFIVVGRAIGVLPVLILIVAMTALGLSMLRRAPRPQGQIDPGRMLAQGAFRAIAAILLILPGFLTGTLGLALLIPGVQRALLRRVQAKMPKETVIDAEFTVIETERIHPPRNH